MQARNALFVKLADVFLCYHDKSKARSGTTQTVRVAIQKGIKVYNFCSSRGS